MNNRGSGARGAGSALLEYKQRHTATVAPDAPRSVVSQKFPRKILACQDCLWQINRQLAVGSVFYEGTKMAAFTSSRQLSRRWQTSQASFGDISKRRSWLTGSAFLGWMFLMPCGLNAALILTFADGDSLDGHVANSTANFVIDLQSAVLTTRSVAPSGTVNTTSGALGINAVGGDTANAFDNGESWAFDWSIDTLFQGIEFEGLNNIEKFTVQNSSWMGLSITPSNVHVTFDALLGKFTLTDDGGDNFNLTDLSSGAILPVSAGSILTLAFENPGLGSATLQSLTFSSNPASIPEPSTLVLAGVASLALLVLCDKSVSGFIVPAALAGRAA